MAEITYTVPDLSCEHCRRAIGDGLARVRGVESVDVDLEAKRVVVRGSDLDDDSLRAAIDEAGYRAA